MYVIMPPLGGRAFARVQISGLFIVSTVCTFSFLRIVNVFKLKKGLTKVLGHKNLLVTKTLVTKMNLLKH